MWNADTVRRLALWYETEAGIVALHSEYRLFQHLLCDWPRRGNSLLDVGCGSGVFLEMLWEYGFDVTGLDNSLVGIDMARERLGQRADFRIGQPDYLPFEDESMEYAALISVLEYAPDPKSVLAEALRVASRGIILGFMNRWSWYGVLAGPPWPWVKNDDRRVGRWLDWWQVSRMVRELAPGARIRSRSVLLGSPQTWREGTFWRRVNGVELPVPLGAFVGMRVDKPRAVPLTPLPLSTEERQEKQEEACAACSTII